MQPQGKGVEVLEMIRLLIWQQGALTRVETRFGPNRVAADMEGNVEFDFWRHLHY